MDIALTIKKSSDIVKYIYPTIKSRVKLSLCKQFLSGDLLWQEPEALCKNATSRKLQLIPPPAGTAGSFKSHGIK